MLTREVYINTGASFSQLMSDKCVFVKIENNIIGGPASLSADNVINHRSFVSMSNVPLAQRIYPSCPHNVAALFVKKNARQWLKCESVLRGSSLWLAA